MIITTTVLVALVSCRGVSRPTPASQIESADQRRYDQLIDVMRFSNPDFDERQYFAYGCNCMFLGDRPMSEPGHGPAVDPLDGTCKAYKDCLKCAKMSHGNECIPEFHRYRYGLEQGGLQCTDEPHTCKRALCECDIHFAKEYSLSVISGFDATSGSGSTSGLELG